LLSRFLGAFAKLRKANISFVMCVCPSVLPHGTRLPFGRIFHEISPSAIFRKSVERIQVSLKSDRKTGALYEELCAFVIISRSVLGIMRNASYKIYRVSHNSHFIFNNFFLLMPLMT
jgi:uncharacterized BrkB/YihY/UPF0761 family membrane protein